MKSTRTKEQIAFDGVKTAWHSDTFTEILHQQVATQFYMDGVIPGEVVSNEEKTPVQAPVRERISIAKNREVQPAHLLVGVMDGVRLPWKKKYRTA